MTLLYVNKTVIQFFFSCSIFIVLVKEWEYTPNIEHDLYNMLILKWWLTISNMNFKNFAKSAMRTGFSCRLSSAQRTEFYNVFSETVCCLSHARLPFFPVQAGISLIILWSCFNFMFIVPGLIYVWSQCFYNLSFSGTHG